MTDPEEEVVGVVGVVGDWTISAGPNVNVESVSDFCFDGTSALGAADPEQATRAQATTAGQRVKQMFRRIESYSITGCVGTRSPEGYTSVVRTAVVFRCGVCGAPLEVATDAGSSVVCMFCEAQNHPQLIDADGAARRAQNVMRAAKEAKQMARDHQPQIEALTQKSNESYVAGDIETAKVAFEGMIRLSNAGSYHMLLAMDPGDPVRVDGLEELDRGINEAVETICDIVS